ELLDDDIVVDFVAVRRSGRRLVVTDSMTGRDDIKTTQRTLIERHHLLFLRKNANSTDESAIAAPAPTVTCQRLTGAPDHAPRSHHPTGAAAATAFAALCTATFALATSAGDLATAACATAALTCACTAG